MLAHFLATPPVKNLEMKTLVPNTLTLLGSREQHLVPWGRVHHFIFLLKCDTLNPNLPQNGIFGKTLLQAKDQASAGWRYPARENHEVPLLARSGRVLKDGI